MPSEDIQTMIFRLPLLLLALPIHEFAHGFAAYKLGDYTAKQDGRLSFNPLRHLDLIGTILILRFGFGWAKPVMVNPAYLKNPKRDMAIISFSGPLSNFILAFVSWMILYPIWVHLSNSGADTSMVNYFDRFAAINIGLGVFNMLPLPPLDGSKVFSAILPDKWYNAVMRVNTNYMMLVVMILAATGALSYVIFPLIEAVTGAYLTLVTKIYFFL
ncbi:MAG: site-2 protease family protein [Clostridiales bacterium]|jgi:Zn-dependent protease|nr:site-2 protease family protein [Clostridiales bacterium]